MTRRSAGFTLVELMVAIALVIVLMLGVSQVFKTTTATLSAGSAISDNTRDARAAQSVLSRDIASIAPDAPCMLLMSCTQAAFRNRLDELGDIRSVVPTPADLLTIDLDGNNTEGEPTVSGEVISPATYNYRNHRTDIFSFFGRGLFNRQTGGTVASNGLTPFIAQQTASEAWVWFGHLRLPDNVGNFGTLTDPGAGTIAVNPNNLYATQWILAREQMLLVDREPDVNTAAAQVLDKNGDPQIFINRSWTYTDGTSPRISLSPMSYQSGDNSGTYEIQQSRYDLAATTIAGFDQRLQYVIQDNDPPANLNTYDWYSRLFLSPGRRFQANPFILRPMTPATYSQQSPMFLRGCTQFIVEYSGDFLSQNGDSSSPGYGDVLDTCYDTTANPDLQRPTDGKIDFVVIGTGATARREIRWYGMPRDVDGDGLIRGSGTAVQMRESRDVVPLRDYWQIVPTEATGAAPWEKQIVTKLPKRPNYLAAGAGGMTSNDQYICAWGPRDRNRPKMLRITITLDDPQGRLQNPDGQTFEFVYELP